MRLEAAVVVLLFASTFSAFAQLSRSQEDAAKKIAATVCASCHTVDGNSLQPAVPKLAGLQSQYLLKQLKDYIAGKRKNGTATPCGPELNPDDVAGLADYFNGQKPAPGKIGDSALAAEGSKVYDQGNSASGVDDCQQCHNPDGKGSGRYPRVAGQHARLRHRSDDCLKDAQAA